MALPLAGPVLRRCNAGPLCSSIHRYLVENGVRVHDDLTSYSVKYVARDGSICEVLDSENPAHPHEFIILVERPGRPGWDRLQVVDREGVLDALMFDPRPKGAEPSDDDELQADR